jgi:hypothetical protein
MSASDPVTRPTPLSAPPRISAPLRDLNETERGQLLRIADILIPGTEVDTAARATSGYDDLLRTALAARSDAFTEITGFLADAADHDDAELSAELRRRHTNGDPAFRALSAVIAGAYLLAEPTRVAIGYPGQHRDPPAIDLAADEIGSGILEPVIERGPIYVDPAAADTTG